MKKIKAWALYPYATTRSWGRLEIFRDEDIAKAMACIDPFYKELVEIEFTFKKVKKSNKSG